MYYKLYCIYLTHTRTHIYIYRFKYVSNVGKRDKCWKYELTLTDVVECLNNEVIETDTQKEGLLVQKGKQQIWIHNEVKRKYVKVSVDII